MSKIVLLTTTAALGFATALRCGAAPSIDFLSQTNASTNFESVTCQAFHVERGLEYTQAAQADRRALAVNLKGLLAGDDGVYRVVCTAKEAASGDTYATVLEGIKFTQGEPGSFAPEFDPDNKGYGLRIPPSGRVEACYDRVHAIFDERCLNEYYGNKPLHLFLVQGPKDVQLHDSAYSSNIGAFLSRNPRHQP